MGREGLSNDSEVWGQVFIIEWCKRPTQAFRWNLCGWGGGGGWKIFFICLIYY